MDILLILGVGFIILFMVYQLFKLNKLQKQIKLQEMNENNLKKDYVFYPKDRARRAVVVGVLVDRTLRLGVSECSKKDQFTKIKGRNIAKGRALSKHASAVVELAAIDNKSIWEQFLEAAKTAQLVSKEKPKVEEPVIL